MTAYFCKRTVVFVGFWEKLNKRKNKWNMLQ